jgi:hypothetical protein
MEETRLKELDDANALALQQLCGVGNLLTASQRRKIVTEVLLSYQKCAFCLETAQMCFKTPYLPGDAQHGLSCTQELVHWTCNLQHHTSIENDAFFHRFIALLKEEYSYLQLSHPEDWWSLYMEIVVVSAWTCGIVALSHSLGNPVHLPEATPDIQAPLRLLPSMWVQTLCDPTRRQGHMR